MDSHSQYPFRSKMVAYYYDKKDDRLTSLSTYTIPARVQGVTFDASGKVYLSTSYGRNESSYIKCYKSLIALSSRPNRPDITIEMPPGSEELDSVDKRLYVIFESAGEKYLEGTDGKGNSPAPIDKILRINTDSFKINYSIFKSFSTCLRFFSGRFCLAQCTWNRPLLW